MELRQLRYFAAIQQHRSFTRAAQELHVTQPTVTTALRNLEEELGTSLIDRSSCQLTPAGEELLRRAETIFRNLDAITEEIKNGAYRQHKLCIAVPPVSCASLYAPILNEFAPSHPDIDLRIDDRCNAELLKHLQNYENDIDAGFIIQPEGLPENIAYLDLTGGSLYALLPASHPLARIQGGIRLEDLTRERILMYDRGTSYTEARITKEFERRGIPFSATQYFSNISTILDVVSQGYGISFILETESPTLTHTPNVVMKSFKDPIRYRIGLIWNKSIHMSAACREFIRFIKDRYHLTEE